MRLSVGICILVITILLVGPAYGEFKFDKMTVQTISIGKIQGKTNTLAAPPYTVEPGVEGGDYFVCLPGSMSTCGYRPSNSAGWAHYLGPDDYLLRSDIDSIEVDFDFNYDFAEDDTFFVYAMLEPDSTGTFHFAQRYPIPVPGNSTQNTWINIRDGFGDYLRFSPNPDLVDQYGGIGYLFFVFRSNDIQSGYGDGMGFGVAIDNLVVRKYSGGSTIPEIFNDSYEDIAVYGGGVNVNGKGFFIDFIDEPFNSPDKWTWIDSYFYEVEGNCVIDVKTENWGNLKRMFR
jgi:hypothetical protein